MNETQFGQLIEPSPVKFDFGAPGWYVLEALLLLIVAFLIWLFIQHWQKNRYRRVAIEWLNSQEYSSQNNQQWQLLYNANMLMKRIAMSIYGRSNVADLKNNAWLDFLNKSSGRAIFTDEDAQYLSNQFYKFNSTENYTNTFITKAKQWIRQHKKNTGMNKSSF